MLLVPSFFVGGNIIYSLLQLGKDSFEPFVVTCCFVKINRTLYNKVFNICFKFKSHERKIVLRIHNATIFTDKFPVYVVNLLDQLVKLPVPSLCFNDKIQKGFQVIFPMAHCLHHVNVIADPVFVGHQNFSVNKDQTSVGKNIALHLMQEKTELWIGGGED